MAEYDVPQKKMKYVPAVMPAVVTIVWLRELVVGLDDRKKRAIAVLVFSFAATAGSTFVKLAKQPSFALSQPTRAVSHNAEQARQGVSYYGDQAWLLAKDFLMDTQHLRVAEPWGIRLDPLVFGCFVLGFVLTWVQIIRDGSGLERARVYVWD
jgi:hypothetical protein